jgi:hypothetical protein
MIRIATLLVIASCFAVLIGMAAWSVARGHEAPLGWQYALQCCSNQDCSQIPASAVQEGPQGYTLNITPEMNNQLAVAKTFTVPYGDSRIRYDGQDGYFHVCIGSASPAFVDTEPNRLLCLYVPPRGF